MIMRNFLKNNELVSQNNDLISKNNKKLSQNDLVFQK